MSFKMNNKLLRNGLIVLAVAGASELAFRGYKKLRQYLGERSMINDVLFINNYSMNCFKQHEQGRSCTNKFCYKKNFEQIISLIDSAQKSLSLGMYIFTSQEIGSAIVRAQERGVVVRVIGDRSMSFSTGSQMLNFLKHSISIRFNLSELHLMHHKFCLIDVDWKDQSTAIKVKANPAPPPGNIIIPKGGLLITGSLNWTMQGFTANWDNILITSNKSHIDCFQTEFERMWQDFDDKRT